MNRREALKTMAGGSLAAIPVPILSGKMGEWVEFPQNGWRLIDHRFNFKISLSELEDGEGGYLHGCPVFKATDGKLYATLASYNGNNCWGQLSNIKPEDDSTYPSYSALIYKFGDNYYAKFEEESLKVKRKYSKEMSAGLPPVILALNRSYPLVDKVGDFYVFPIALKDMLKNETYKANYQVLSQLYNCLIDIKAKFGVDLGLSCYLGNTPQEQFKWALGIEEAPNPPMGGSYEAKS